MRTWWLPLWCRLVLLPANAPRPPSLSSSPETAVPRVELGEDGVDRLHDVHAVDGLGGGLDGPADECRVVRRVPLAGGDTNGEQDSCEGADRQRDQADAGQ